jgi:hypothetical protein
VAHENIDMYMHTGKHMFMIIFTILFGNGRLSIFIHVGVLLE